MYKNTNKRRQIGVVLLFCVCFLLVIARMYNRQIVRYEFFKKKADNQHKVMIKLPPKRGTIYDRSGRILALDTPIASVYAVARDINNKKKVAKELSKILFLNKDAVYRKITKDKAFVWIKRSISEKEYIALKKADIDGVGFIKETKRSYPNSTLMSHILGFTDIDNNGLEGIELHYEKFLKGTYGWKTSFRDARQQKIATWEESFPAKEGYNIVLTVDEVIQHIVKEELDKVVKKHKPKTAMIIVMDPNTGEVLAMSSYPGYDLNSYGKAPRDSLKNRAISDVYEPGSVFKAITASAVIDSGKVKPEDIFYCENGEFRVSKRVLHDHHPYGNLTFRKVIEKSSNIGTAKAAAKLGQDEFYAYIKKFGFGEPTGIDLRGEENGILRNVSTWTPSDMTTLPMGQGISCTSLQLGAALSAIANGGTLVTPYIVEKITDSSHQSVKEFHPQLKRRVINKATSDIMKEILKGAVENGTGKRAKLADYYVCGKTGTAQKVIGRSYAKGKYVASFMGFAPFDKPQLVVVVSVDEPKGGYYGGLVAAPVFKGIMGKSLKYLEIKKEK